MSQHCPSEEDFAKAVSTRDEASDSSTGEVFAHLETCSSCARLFAEMTELANAAKLVSWKAPSEEAVRRLAARVDADATSSLGVLAKEKNWNRPSARTVENVRQRVLVSGARGHKETKVARWVAAGLAAAVFALAGSRMTHWQSPAPQEIAADPSSVTRVKPANESPISPGEPTIQPLNEKVPEVAPREIMKVPEVAPREIVKVPESRPRETVRSHEPTPVNGIAEIGEPEKKENGALQPSIALKVVEKAQDGPPPVSAKSREESATAKDPAATLDRKEIRQDTLQDLRLRREDKQEDKKEAREERREDRKEFREERREDRKEKREERRERRAK